MQLGQLGNLVILEVLVSWGRDGRFRPVALGEWEMCDIYVGERAKKNKNKLARQRGESWADCTVGARKFFCIIIR